jgi:endonuclease/exonuclease/phosphatase family metal-dependent hydrolase
LSAPARLRVLTFNIHGGRPARGPVDLGAIAAVIRKLEPDLVALQEVHCYLPPPYVFRDQPRLLRKLLGMELYFGRTLGLGPVGYGNAVLSRLPGAEFRALALPTTRDRRGLEPRGLIEARVPVGDERVRFLNTHLGLTAEQRALQVSRIADELRTHHEPVILAGDLNASPESPELQQLLQTGLRDCASDESPTFPAEAPRCRIDHLLVSPHFTVERCYAVETTVSDHRPLVADLQLRWKRRLAA